MAEMSIFCIDREDPPLEVKVRRHGSDHTYLSIGNPPQRIPSGMTHWPSGFSGDHITIHLRSLEDARAIAFTIMAECDRIEGERGADDGRTPTP